MSTSIETKPTGCTSFKLRQLVRIVGQGYDAALSDLGLKITQYSLLSHIVNLGPIRSVDLAERMSMDASTLSRNLNPLKAAGFIELQSMSDSRSRSIVATPQGKALCQTAQKRWKLAQQALNVRLGSQRVAQLHQLLDDSLQLLSKP